MAFSHTVTSSISTGGGTSTTHSKTYTADAQKSYSIPVADSVTDQESNVAMDLGQAVNFFIVCDQDVLVEGNDSAGAQFSLALKANVPVVWNADQDFPFDTPLGVVDWTTIFITNASGSAATVTIEILEDSTP